MPPRCTARPITEFTSMPAVAISLSRHKPVSPGRAARRYHEASAAMHSTLIVIEGPLKGTLLPLHEGEVSIGRDDSNTLAIDDLAASRCHCKIRRDRDRFRLTDAGSRNGT